MNVIDNENYSEIVFSEIGKENADLINQQIDRYQKFLNVLVELDNEIKKEKELECEFNELCMTMPESFDSLEKSVEKQMQLDYVDYITNSISKIEVLKKIVRQDKRELNKINKLVSSDVLKRINVINSNEDLFILNVINKTDIFEGALTSLILINEIGIVKEYAKDSNDLLNDLKKDKVDFNYFQDKLKIQKIKTDNVDKQSKVLEEYKKYSKNDKSLKPVFMVINESYKALNKSLNGSLTKNELDLVDKKILLSLKECSGYPYEMYILDYVSSTLNIINERILIKEKVLVKNGLN